MLKSVVTVLLAFSYDKLTDNLSDQESPVLGP